MIFWLVRTGGQPCASCTKNLTKQGELTLSYTRNNEKPREAPLYVLFAYSYKMGGGGVSNSTDIDYERMSDSISLNIFFNKTLSHFKMEWIQERRKVL